MKILQVHNAYRERGGEWEVFHSERELLADGGHEVTPFLKDNREALSGLLPRIRQPFRTHYSVRSREEVRKELRRCQAGLMHVHNFFPLLTPSIFDAALEERVPSVMTLHNYRLIHPNGQLMHDGKIDERSVRGSAWTCVPDGVYRNSILQTAVVAYMIEYHRKKGTWNRVPTRFIALTEFAKRKFVEGGLPEERIRVKPNFIHDPFEKGGVLDGQPVSPEERITKAGEYGESQVPDPGGPHDRGGEETGRRQGRSAQGGGSPYFLYAGRISREKGVEDLIRCWNRYQIDAELRILGDGPERKKLEEMSDPNMSIRWLGRQAREEVLRQMHGATALLFPSRWYEGFPLTLVEALSVGCPAIVTRIGSQAEIIRHGEAGFQVQPGNIDEIRTAARSLLEQPALRRALSETAREEYLAKYTPEINLRQLERIYEEAVE
ncbi:MAG: glycosyltransferase family 4 protein [Balneolaceae bacterium]